MDTSLFLARLIGPILVVMAIGLLARQDSWRAMADEFLLSRPLLFLSGFLTLLGGLAIVNTHNIWTGGWPVIITILGWLALIALVVALVSGNGSRATALRRQVRHSSEVVWERAMEWQHSFVVSLAVTIVAVVILFATDLPTFWNLLLVVVAVLAGITAWFSSRPDDTTDAAGADESEVPSGSQNGGAAPGARGSTDGSPAPAG